MPCQDHYSTNNYCENDELKERLDSVTELLCFVMEEQDNSSWYMSLYFGKFNDKNKQRIVEDLKSWWENHKEEDRKAHIQYLQDNAKKLRQSRILEVLEKTLSAEEIDELKEIFEEEEGFE